MAGPFKMKGFSGFGNSPMKQDETKVKSKPGPGGTFTHPSGISDAQVTANKKAGMVWYADRDQWQYPEDSGLPTESALKQKGKVLAGGGLGGLSRIDMDSKTMKALRKYNPIMAIYDAAAKNPKAITTGKLAEELGLKKKRGGKTSSLGIKVAKAAKAAAANK